MPSQDAAYENPQTRADVFPQRPVSVEVYARQRWGDSDSRGRERRVGSAHPRGSHGQRRVVAQIEQVVLRMYSASPVMNRPARGANVEAPALRVRRC